MAASLGARARDARFASGHRSHYYFSHRTRHSARVVSVRRDGFAGADGARAPGRGRQATMAGEALGAARDELVEHGDVPIGGL